MARPSLPASLPLHEPGAADTLSTFELSTTMFRAYDIRGLVGTDLTADSIHLIGRAIGSLALEHGHSEVLFGADSRLSSPELAAALQAGLLASGCDILDLG